MTKSKVLKIIRILKKRFPGSKIALKFSNPLEILVATVLSAQCTDVQVNKITPALFKKYKSVKEFAHADLKELEDIIRSTGFYHNKAKNIINAAKILLERFNGKVPGTMRELVELPGVARKTANIVLFNAFGRIEGIAVDTHVRRVSLRLGLTKNDDPKKIEIDLMDIVPKVYWGEFSNLLISHGRAICMAKKPLCQICPLNKICPSVKIFYKNIKLKNKS